MSDQIIKYRPSNAAIWSQCSLQPVLAEELGVNSYKTYRTSTEKGTRLHAELEKALTIPGYELSKEDSNVLSDSMEIIKNYMRPTYVMHVEKYWDLLNQLTYDGKSVGVDFGGTPDVAVISKNHIHIFDFKTTVFEIIEAHNNPQLIMYAYLAYIHVWSRPRPPLEKIMLTILQPYRNNYDTVIYDHNTFFRLVDSIFEKTRQIPLSLKLGKHCRWCPLKEGCPEIKNKLNELYFTIGGLT